MRIIKLSEMDEEMQNEDMVHKYFKSTLKIAKPTGQFLMTKGRISQDGIHQGEKIVFSYRKKIVYLGVAASGRKKYRGPQRWLPREYPHYFCIDMDKLRPGRGAIDEFEKRVFESDLHDKNIVQAQGWPRLEDSKELDQLWYEFINE